MSSLWILFSSLLLIAASYFTYANYIRSKLITNIHRLTPARTKEDGIDYVVTNRYVLFGHHFASIAGAGPIVGPIIAIKYGWLPCILWIILGSIFIGGVHDFASIVISAKNEGKSIGTIIEKDLGKKGKFFFLVFSWFTLLLVIAVFANLVAQTFVGRDGGPVATASLMFMAVAVIFGLVNRLKLASLWVSTVGGVILIFACMWIGVKYPIPVDVFGSGTETVWKFFLLAYVAIASIIPVWILLQPRDFLNSFLLFALISLALVGLVFYNPEMKIRAFNGFVLDREPLFPILFITIACGAVSGFHSLVASGTTSKQIESFKDAKFIGYGGMLLEAVLAVIALIAAGYMTGSSGGSAVEIFANGVGNFLTKVGIPEETGIVFASLAVASFLLTTLDTATRLARYAFQEFFEKTGSSEQPVLAKNRYIATLITIIVSAVLIFSGGVNEMWPIFGSANQLLACLALLAVTLWMSRLSRAKWFLIWPFIFMLVVTLSSLVILLVNHFKTGNYILSVISMFLFIVAVLLVINSCRIMLKQRKTP
ncbi:MAG: carbon starvation protein A [Candidatus Aureabacteria bacterium]|nr:carbon starvation protein A [Candidatus Auribacterota bacterium]